MILLFNTAGAHVLSCQHIPDSHNTEEYVPAELPATETYDYNRIYTLVDGEIVVGDLKPVDEEMIAAVEAEIARTEYQRLRARAYPSIANQLDTLFHGGYEAWKEQIQAIKDTYPKS
jgi:hypothetical protein